MSIVLYPCFLECSKCTNDSFWKSIFEDLAFGVCPCGVFITKNFLCCNYKNKEFSYKIDKNKDSNILFKEIYNLLHYKFKLSSKQQQDQLQHQFEKKASLIYSEHKDWNSIKKKTLKSYLLDEYILSMKKTYELDSKNTKYLSSMVNIGLMFKTIVADDIQFKNSKIQKINGIICKKNKVIIKKNLYQDGNSKTDSVDSIPKNMSSNWEKYLIQFIKKYIGLNTKDDTL